MSKKRRPLTGLKIGISISDSEDLNDRGFTTRDVTLITVELCRRIVSLGGAVVLGHQWRPQGLMDAVARFAQIYRGESPTPDEPIIYNFLAMPDRAALSDSDRRELAGFIRIEEDIHGNIPDHPMAPTQTSGDTKDDQRLRTGNLTAMRRQMSSIVDARICLGGRKEQGAGFVHGVLEEAALDIMNETPVYISGLMGGTSAILVGIIRQGIVPTFEQTSAQERPENKLKNKQNIVNPALPIYISKFRTLTREALARICGFEEIQVSENSVSKLDQLFDAQNLETIIELVAHGLLVKKQKPLNATS